MPDVNFLITTALVLGVPIISPFTNVNMGLYVEKVTPLLASVHCRLMYFDWLRPEADGGAAATVDASMLPAPPGVPEKRTVTGA